MAMRSRATIAADKSKLGSDRVLGPLRIDTEIRALLVPLTVQ